MSGDPKNPGVRTSTSVDGFDQTHEDSGGTGDDWDDSQLTPGRQLGRYEVLDLLGSGGMGRVYRALDPSLGREVAIKALAQTFRGDSGNLRRFEREARVLAALSHPNIATIYGFERFDGAPYLILERVDGETLGHRLRRGAMPLREALAVAIQVVEGLEEAHRKGVIHRDLKPSNVMLAPGGRAKLVDFGLAKAAPAQGDTPSEADPITAAGAVVGTAAYMSPEQVHGEEVDTGTDVWAFGCLLYEMLVGRPAFRGRSMGEVLAAVLRDEPDWSALPESVPPGIRRLLRRCLRRDPHTRLQHIGDARLELMEAEGEPIPPSASWSRSARVRRAMPWVLAGASITAAGWLFLVQRTARVRGSHPVRLSLELPSSLALVNEYAAPFAIDPSGSTLVLQAREGQLERLFVRVLNDTALRALPGTEDATQPFFSADGRSVAFFASRKLSRIPLDGGAVLPLAEIGGNPRGGTWTSGGTIVVAPSQTSGLVRFSEQGGRPAPLTTLDPARGEYSHRWPEALPGGEWVLFTVGLEDANFDEGRIEAVSLRTGQRREVLAGAAFAKYLPPGRLLFVREGRLNSVAFDPQNLEVSGEPEVVLDAVRYDPRNGGCHLAVSTTGVVVYGPGVATSGESYIAWVDREGRLTRAVDTPRPFRDPRLSPDGRRIAVGVGTSTESDLWLVDGNVTFSRLSFGLAPHRPTWTPDGNRIIVGAEKDGRWRLLSIAADGRGEPVTLFESANRLYPNVWSPDGRQLVFQEKRPDTGWDLRILSVDPEGGPVGTPAELAATLFQESNAAISPNGRWVAYESDELDAIVQIYVRSLKGAAAKVRGSSGGGRWPMWAASGGRLFYWHTGPSRLRVAPAREEGGALVVGPSVPVWGTESQEPPALARLVATAAGARYDLDLAVPRFLVLETSAPFVDPPFSRPVVALDFVDPGPL